MLASLGSGRLTVCLPIARARRVVSCGGSACCLAVDLLLALCRQHTDDDPVGAQVGHDT